MKKLYYLLIAVIAISLCGPAFGQNKAFVQQDIIKVANITTEDAIGTLGVMDKQTTRTYLDGLGRPVQTVDIQGSVTQKDIIQPVAYDNLGRTTKGYMPYAGSAGDAIGAYRSNALTAQAAYYSNGTADKVVDDASPFSQQVFEASPLQRLLQAGMPGAGFQPGVSGNHYKSVAYRSNNSGDGNIIMWAPDGTRTGYYAANSLSVTVAIDEDGLTMMEFKDAAGRVVLKRQPFSVSVNYDTYYVYNEAGMASYAIPPKATELLVANSSYTLSTAPVASLIYRYYYDGQGLLVKKVVPSKGVLTIVYDPLNRPVLMQDANLALAHKWNYIKYDAKGRPVSQGIYTDLSHTDADIQTVVNAFDYANNWFEKRSTASSTGYYDNASFPNTNIEPLSYSYFDGYNLAGTAFTYAVQSITGGESSPTTAGVKGMPTMVRTRSVGEGLSNIWLLKVMFYDKYGQLVQVRSNNQLNYNTDILTDAATNEVDAFKGTIQKTQVTKVTGSGTANTKTIYTAFVYDHRNRVTNIDQTYDGGAVQHVAIYSYNELGQLVDKKIGGNAAQTSWLQSVDLRYNIHGQLTSINNSRLENDGVLNDDGNDVFGMQLYYEKGDAKVNDWFYYNGRLNSVKWMSKDASGAKSYERAFTYLYDQAGRYTAAGYEERPSTASTTVNFTVTHGWDETVTSYDANGNIQGLQRNSASQGSGTYTAIDALTYGYSTTNANQLLTVSDGTGNAGGFRNYMGNTTLAYTYDANGNLLTDPYKGLTYADYNVLNRPSKITMSYGGTGRYMKYTYDASGQLIRKQKFDNNTPGEYTDYIDGFVYSNGSFSYAPIPEGRLRANAGSLKQEFIITDQQGNARVSFEDNGSGQALVTQETSYYGFGLQLTNSPVTPAGVVNKQLYNGGAEQQDDFADLPGYQRTFYRNYDAVLGRWTAVDPIPEASESMSVFSYAGNNPVMQNDPLGDLTQSFVQALLNATPENGKSHFTNNGNGGLTQDDSFSTNGRFFEFSDYVDIVQYALAGGGFGYSIVTNGGDGPKLPPGNYYNTFDGNVIGKPETAWHGMLFERLFTDIFGKAKYEWIQIVSKFPKFDYHEGAGPIDNPLVDGPRDHAMNEYLRFPFYNEANEPMYLTVGGKKLLHYKDSPHSKDANQTFDSVTALVSVDSKGFLAPLLYYTWGYHTENGVTKSYPLITSYTEAPKIMRDFINIYNALNKISLLQK